MPSKYEGEFKLRGDEDITYEAFVSQRTNEQNTMRHAGLRDTVNEVGVLPTLPPEIYEERAKYSHDLVLALQELFPDSTGLKPFGKVQIESTEFIQYIFHNKGRLILLEPRGYAKTTRITNASTLGALEGIQRYIVIVTSSLSKSQDILEDIRTELTTNERLAYLYPGTCACFKHLERSSHKSKRQTYGGEFTYIANTLTSIHFPVVPGEPSSGCIIEVRPATNVKGLKHKIEGGPFQGKVQRPTLYLFDDPQTEDDADSEKNRKKIIKNIKRSALKGGTHQDPVSAIMAITPVSFGDVAWHFATNEESWDIKRYKMVESMPVNTEIWYNDYNEIRSSFDREVRGSRAKARRRAAKFVEENYEEMHTGSAVSWEHAFNPHEPQFEVSALQHAFNIILDDGIEDFEYECQSNIEYGVYEESDAMHCPTATIAAKTNPLPRRIVPQGAAKIVSHIDVNKDILTYVTIASPKEFRPYIIDYGTWPNQNGRFSKRKITQTLATIYPQTEDYREVLYLGCLDLIAHLATMKYKREDGIEKSHDVIGIDMRYEEVYTSRACRETPFHNIIVPCWGAYVGPDDELLHEKHQPESANIFENCVEVPNRDHTLDMLMIDVNFFKTEVHKAFNKTLGINGSMSLFNGVHQLFAEHHNIEYPKRVPGKRSIRTKIQWYAKLEQPDNEYFDNTTACLALLVREGISLDSLKSLPTHGAREIKVLSDLMERDTTTLW